MAIDGRCGSGKTTLARELALRYPARIFHTDDFYLPFARREKDWQHRPGGNMDFERLREEVLAPARAGKAVSYRPYLAHADLLEEEQVLEPCALSILEGSYSLHPSLKTDYDFRLFLTCSSETQASRLRAREGDNYSLFEKLWIPLEEGYFRSFGVQERCDLIVST